MRMESLVEKVTSTGGSKPASCRSCTFYSGVTRGWCIPSPSFAANYSVFRIALYILEDDAFVKDMCCAPGVKAALIMQRSSQSGSSEAMAVSTVQFGREGAFVHTLRSWRPRGQICKLPRH